MKLVFQENPKFGDEQDVTQQIISIDEHIEKLLAEIKRFEVIQIFLFFSNPLKFFVNLLSLISLKSNEHVLQFPLNMIQQLVYEQIMVLINR
jgi:hypothetical protein